MKFIKKTWIFPVLFTVVILVVGGLYIGSLLTKENPLSDSEIRMQLENIYGGTVDNLSMEGEVYVAEMTRLGAVYSAEIVRLRGKFCHLFN